MANKTNAETQKNIKKMIGQIQELQLQVQYFSQRVCYNHVQVEEEQRGREECRENYLSSERKLTVCSYAMIQHQDGIRMIFQILLSEKKELETQKEQSEQQKRRLESEVSEQRTQKSENQTDNLHLTAVRRSLENELQLTKVCLVFI